MKVINWVYFYAYAVLRIRISEKWKYELYLFNLYYLRSTIYMKLFSLLLKMIYVMKSEFVILWLLGPIMNECLDKCETNFLPQNACT